MRHLNVLLAAGTLVLGGCANNSAFQIVPFPNQTARLDDSAKCRIYIVRDTIVGAAYTTEILDGDNIVGSVEANTYLCWERQPGQTVISGRGAMTPTILAKQIKLDAEPGKVYYIREHMWFTGALRLVSEKQGEKAVRKCHPPSFRDQP